MASLFEGTDALWDSIVSLHDYSGAVLQSSKWVNVQRARGNPFAQIIDEHGNPSLWVALPITPMVWVWYSPKGPAVMPDGTELNSVIAVLQGIKHGTVLRIEPPMGAPSHTGFSRRREISPANTLLTRVDRTDDELMKSFHEKTRYNIRLAMKHEVHVRRMVGDDLIAHADEIVNLYYATGARHDIQPLPREDLKALFSVCEVWAAFFDDRIVATSLHIGFGRIMTYLHGASRYEDRAVMAPHALHWAIMRDARDRGFATYDWWGIAPEDELEHKLSGVTRFKLGFGGERVQSPGTFDLGIDRVRYALYTLATRRRR